MNREFFKPCESCGSSVGGRSNTPRKTGYKVFDLSGNCIIADDAGECIVFDTATAASNAATAHESVEWQLVRVVK
jgi:hypothetical protein